MNKLDKYLSNYSNAVNGNLFYITDKVYLAKLDYRAETRMDDIYWVYSFKMSTDFYSRIGARRIIDGVIAALQLLQKYIMTSELIIESDCRMEKFDIHHGIPGRMEIEIDMTVRVK